jgi:hypothetical protein
MDFRRVPQRNRGSVSITETIDFEQRRAIMNVSNRLMLMPNDKAFTGVAASDR